MSIFPQVSVWSPVSRSESNTDLQVSEGEDHRLGQVDPAGAAVHRGRNDVGVDHQARPPGVRALGQTQAESQRGVLGGQEGAQVLVESEDQLHLTCRGRERVAGDTV